MMHKLWEWLFPSNRIIKVIRMPVLYVVLEDPGGSNLRRAVTRSPYKAGRVCMQLHADGHHAVIVAYVPSRIVPS